ncbi:MAG TPA: hypothetical protein VGJ23_06630 [Gaiellaceae bacterium]
MEVHRSRYELERILSRYGAHDVLFVEADANASIQFAIHGRYVQLALPLPDPETERFTHTPSGRRRTAAAQERAYEQALREHWRSLVLAVRGKLQSVESGISTFEHEFGSFLVPHFAEEKKNRKAPKAVNWLLGGSHTLAIGLVAAFLVPASAVSAFALPTNVVDHLSAAFGGSLFNLPNSPGGEPRALALEGGGWTVKEGRLERDAIVTAALDDASASAPEGGAGEVGAGGASPEGAAGGGASGSGGSSESSGAAVSGADAGAVSNGGQPSGGDKPSAQTSGSSDGGNAPAAGHGNSGSAGRGSPDPGGAAGPPAGESGGTSTAEPPGGDGAAGSTTDPGPAESPPAPPLAEPPPTETPPTETPPTETPPAPGSDHDNGNHNGADNGVKNGADNGSNADGWVNPGKGKP